MKKHSKIIREVLPPPHPVPILPAHTDSPKPSLAQPNLERGLRGAGLGAPGPPRREAVGPGGEAFRGAWVLAFSISPTVAVLVEPAAVGLSPRHLAPL